MFRRRIKSSLFIDFDNLFLAGQDESFAPDFGPRFVASIANWLAWLEDGAFEDGDVRPRRRRFIGKRVYLGYRLREHQEAFRVHGFDTYVGRSFTGRPKSTADLMIGIDAMETLCRETQVAEFMIVSSDTDFVPLIDRLNENGKTTVAVYKDRTSHAAYEERATITIDAKALMRAFDYRRPLSLFERLFGRRRPRAPRVAAPQHASSVVAEGAAVESGPRVMAGQIRQGVALLRREGEARKRYGRQLRLGRSAVIARLSIVPGFATNGPRKFFGLGSYENLIAHIGETEEDFDVVEAGDGGVVLEYQPVDVPSN